VTDEVAGAMALRELISFVLFGLPATAYDDFRKV